LFGPLRGGRLFSALVAAWLVSFAAGPLAAADGSEPPTYLIGPGDVLSITVWRQPELSTAVIVRPDGRFSMPLVEEIFAAGKTPEDLADEIEATLSQYVQEPRVSVDVSGGVGDVSQQIRVIGEAAAPQALPYRSGMTVLDAIIASGGLSRQADGNAAVILRASDGLYETIPVRLADLVRDGVSSANQALVPGDIIVIPEGFFEGEWRATYGMSASQTFSDNIDQNPSGERDPGLVTRAGPQMSIRGNSARVTAAFSGNISAVQEFGGDNPGFSLDPRLSGTSTTELAPDLVFFDLSASVSRQLLDSRQSTSASGASTSNRDVVATMTASPYLVHRLGDFADAEWRYRFSPVLVSSSNESDAFDHEASFILDSGDDFSFFGWTWTNRAGQEIRTDDSDISSASTDFGVNYALWRNFSLLGSIGYEYRDGDDDNSDNFSNVTWRGGFAWEPNPDLSMRATYGLSDNDENLDASLNYQIGPKTGLRASYSEALESSQERAISNLNRLIFNPETGEFEDEETGEVFDPDDPFTFEDETVRTRTLRVGADHRAGRDTFRLTGLAGTSEGGSQGDEEFYEARLTWGRPLNQEITLTSSARYQRSDFEEDDRLDDTYTLNVGLGYRLSSDARASLNYSFQTRDSTEDDRSYYENAVTVGISLSF
jgi:polysaccharide export outer membrane protein